MGPDRGGEQPAEDAGKGAVVDRGDDQPGDYGRDPDDHPEEAFDQAEDEAHHDDNQEDDIQPVVEHSPPPSLFQRFDHIVGSFLELAEDDLGLDAASSRKEPTIWSKR